MQRHDIVVQAMFDYDTPDPSSLSLKTGDVIQVLNTLESGWWDGYLANSNARGWFPGGGLGKLVGCGACLHHP
ncbi:MAG: hypothetical protein BJ554DRAFT_5637 [Olpidium bornovanus]|uniref:SH3 domain-containing protein n=1 Tax=Olpidium bornovanus TaxID=278681 RepID=A0A8H8A1Y1_9FUNG|nr:MAG: hypothetical protein BJ554DRAFT_5637 [Olpidium bornovanus]